jgi:DNA-binding response OmpR family regulator
MRTRLAAMHRVLIVEDDRATAEDLGAIVKSLGSHSRIVTNKRDALAALRAGTFCLILLDLQIKRVPDSIKGHTEYGNSLLREMRQMHLDHTGACYWLPIVIVSGFAREAAAAVEVMRAGAHDVIQKPFEGRQVSAIIRQALERSGRIAHDLCLAGPSSRVPRPGGKLVLGVPGDRVRRRTRVMVGSQPVMLTDASLRVLLHLMVAFQNKATVHKRELGAKSEQGFKGISVLREALRPTLGEGVDIIGNDYQGNYFLKDGVTIGNCDAAKLAEIGDQKITELARTLRPPRARRHKSDGNS